MTFRHYYGVITPGADRICESVNLYFYKLQAKYITEITACTALNWVTTHKKLWTLNMLDTHNTLSFQL